MSKRRSQIDTGLSNQGSLFDTGGSEGLFDVLLGLKQLMSKQITASGQDRYDIAASVSRMTLRDMSKDMLDKLTSSDPAYEPGVLKLAAFCVSTGSFAPFRYVFKLVNREVIVGAEVALRMQMSQGTVMCHLTTLQDAGFIQEVGGGWRLGMKLAIYWARVKANKEAERDRINKDIEQLGEG